MFLTSDQTLIVYYRRTGHTMIFSDETVPNGSTSAAALLDVGKVLFLDNVFWRD